MTTRSWRASALGALVPLAGLLALCGCVAAPPTPSARTETPAPTSSPDSTTPPGSTSPSEQSPPSQPSGDDTDALHYPDGATPDTPECQDASPAVVAAANATIDTPLPNGSATVPSPILSLSATPDPAHAVWLLTGSIASTPNADGYLVIWATTSDPTQPTFTGTLRSVGSTTATLSSALALEFPDTRAPGGLPSTALRCTLSPRATSQ